jgi:hypothetical protein
MLAQLGVHGRQRLFGRLHAGLLGRVRRAQLGKPGHRRLLAHPDLGHPLAQPRRLGVRLVGPVLEPLGTLAEQHHLVLRLAACLLAVAQRRLGERKLALALEQHQLPVVEPGFERVQRGGDPFAAHRLLLPALVRVGLAAAQGRHLAGGEREVERLRMVLEPLVAAGLAHLARQRAQLALDLEHDVVEPREVALGGVQLGEGFALAGLVLGDPGRLLEQEAAVAGVVREHVVHHLSLDH